MITRRISMAQYTLTVIAFALGTSLIVSVGRQAGKDAWLAILIGAVEGLILGLPLLVLSTRFKGLGISSINDRVWGKYIGKSFTVVLILYTLLMTTRASYNFFNFIKLTLLNGIPDYALDAPTLLIIGLACLLGLEVMARFISIMLPIVLVFIGTVLVLSLPYLDANNIRPVLQTPLPMLLSSAHSVAVFPFSEVMLLFAATIPFPDKPMEAVRATILGMAIATVLFLLVFFRNLGVLGEASQYFLYPAFTSARMINLGGVFTRMEILVSINLTLLGGIKCALLLYMASLMASEMLGLDSITPVVFPFAIIVSVFNHNIFPSVAHANAYLNNIQPIYAMPFLFLLPLLTLVVAIVQGKIPFGGAALPSPSGDQCQGNNR